MRLGIIDVTEWQTIVDFETGYPVEERGELVTLAAEILKASPYPGDLDLASSRWVTDTALRLWQHYQPQLMFLDYASLFLNYTFRPIPADQFRAAVHEVFAEVERFVSQSGFTPVVVGLGDLTPFKGYIDVVHSDGQVAAGGMSSRHAGLYAPSLRDIQALRDHPAVERVDTRDDFRAELGGCDDFYRRFPDVLATAKEGYAFRGVSSGARPIYRMPRYEAAVPWYSPLEGAEKITDVAGMVLQAAQGQRVALILVEAVGCDTFPWPYRTIENCHHWHHYTAGDGQYLTLSSGRQFTEHPYPPGYRFYLEDHERKLYPFSGIYGQRPTGMLGQRFAGRSAAVGNRSVLTHLAAGAQITVECFARALYNQGVMAVCE